jgi:hypothetical protein
VRKSGNRLRVTAPLINAADGYHIWSERYDRELADLFVMQDEIAVAITSALRLRLGTPVDRQPYQPNLAAYEAFLQGRHLVFSNTAESIALAKRTFEQAIQLDPEYAEPHAELATWHFIQAAAGLSAADEELSLASVHALRAVQPVPDEPRAHAVLGGMAALHEHDWARAGDEFARALAARQVPPEVRFRYALF